MRRFCFLLVMATAILAIGCRTQKTGCKIPRRSMGAEKVMDEMNNPPKKGLFRRG
ncbi:hypothetical protein GFS24_28310 [Chitinophaga sp. SYP-B3965]|uniref:hypothetical protein n=1 Tax=Chitinophaga sp. SYP-B3965 TaxID=2663120 RepID=UPI001299FB93|nr:hypothetical protein [Chitinophaga sp. SYP-B3965]MRG49046.1 hypothetical protein [Chitinophaga sp. SYP-B3965]